MHSHSEVVTRLLMSPCSSVLVSESWGSHDGEYEDLHGATSHKTAIFIYHCIVTQVLYDSSLKVLPHLRNPAVGRYRLESIYKVLAWIHTFVLS
jgi:hypothetical protein